MKRLLAALALLALASSLTACSDDCQRLADITCEKAGESSEECTRIREHASSPSADDKQACSLALKVVDEFIGSR